MLQTINTIYISYIGVLSGILIFLMLDKYLLDITRFPIWLRIKIIKYLILTVFVLLLSYWGLCSYYSP